jgi:hypothetical protein
MFLALRFSRFGGESTLPPQAGTASRSAASSNVVKQQKEMTFLSHPRRFRNDKD